MSHNISRLRTCLLVRLTFNTNLADEQERIIYLIKLPAESIKLFRLLATTTTRSRSENKVTVG